jgi:ADP-heptose:LPS heptosyltransferase
LASRSNKILICQGPADAAIVQEVLAGLGSTPYLLVADLPITRLAALLSHASLFIGNDSGISHLAAALGVPTLAIFGPTDPLCWAPRSDRALWLQGQASCAPCSIEQLRSCERQRCLESLGTEAVLAFITEKRMIPAATAFNDGRHAARETGAHRYQGEARIA